VIAGVLSLLGLLLMYDNVYGDLREGPDTAAVIGYDGLLPIELAIPFFLAVTVPLLRGARASFERARERARLQRGTLETTTRGGRAIALVSVPVLAVT